jgi:hypothetical protein
MLGDAIREALGATRDAWSAVDGDDYQLDDEAKVAVQREIDDAIGSLEQAVRLALAEPA